MMTNDLLLEREESNLNEFRGNEFEATLFEASDHFVNESTLNTIMFNHDEGVFAIVGHDDCG
jgi:hypothetical protein